PIKYKVYYLDRIAYTKNAPKYTIEARDVASLEAYLAIDKVLIVNFRESFYY
ncbi:hypothetical protein CC80DRAFT_428070, partial [Byssothecium circinans]